MQCTADQIEEKRRLAQQKLAARQNQTGIVQSSPVRSFNATNVSPKPWVRPEKSSWGRNGSFSSSKSHSPKPYDKPANPGQFYGKQNVVTGTCSLISDERFVVELSGFSQQAIEVFKTIPSRSYSKYFIIFICLTCWRNKKLAILIDSIILCSVC